MILSFENIEKGFGAQQVLEGVTGQIDGHQRVGLIGANGAGKSTLLNIIYGYLHADSGEMRRGSDKTYGFLQQDSGLSVGNTIGEEMRSVFSKFIDMEKEMRYLEQKMTTLSADTTEYQQVSERYTSLQHQFELGEGYQIEAKINRVLHGMGFAQVSLDKSVDVLSGGERTRLALCKLLLKNPDLLILDEPTNHLDFDTLQWLEDYLEEYRGALLIVSHDRYFLNRLCTHIWELENKALYAYPGNYEEYFDQKEQRLLRQQREYDKQQETIEKYEDFIQRNIARASTTGMAQSRRRALERMEKVPPPYRPPAPPSLAFEVRRDPVNDVLEVEELSLGVGNPHRILFQGVSFQLKRGEKIALVGKNGIGKSTMLRALLGKMTPDHGEITWGRNVDLAYFEQGEGDMDAHKSAKQELWDDFPREDRFSIRSTLGRAGIRGDEVEKEVGALSGGERARLKFAKLMLKEGNVLMLDEPTNHLDLPTREVLDHALEGFDGTLIVVSHDRYLLNKFPDKIMEMREDGVTVYNGRYEEYAAHKKRQREKAERERQQQEEQERREEPPAAGGYRTREDRQRAAWRRRRLRQLEESIAKDEEKIDTLQQEVVDPHVAADYEELEKRYLALNKLNEEMEKSLDEWAKLGEEEAADQ